MIYEHAQTGRHMPVIFITLTAILLVWVAISSGDTSAIVSLFVFLGLIGIVLLAFSRLVVEIDGEHVSARFRWGWPRKSFALADIHRVDTVRNKWWYGYGIRLTPHGWMYNVWGLDAVQLNLTEGKAFRIGTDDAELLAATLSGVIGSTESR